MPNIFTYSIANDIPGLVFGGEASDRLLFLIGQGITTPLLNIESTGDVLTITFSTNISSAEKTALDGDVLGPAGGLVGRAADRLALSIASIEILDSDIITLPANGVSSVTVVGQIKRGDDIEINGFGATYNIDVAGLAPISESSGVFDGSGAFSFNVGPSSVRGSIFLTITTTSHLPDRNFVVSFTAVSS